jgi:CRP-like cAMP-binding protein
MRDQLCTIAARCEVVQVKSHELLVKQGETPDRVYLLRVGQLKVIREIGVGSELEPVQVDLLGKYGVFNHIALLSGEPSKISVMAVVSSELVAFTREQFLGLGKQVLTEFVEFQKPYPPDRVLLELVAGQRGSEEYFRQVSSYNTQRRRLTHGISQRQDSVIREPT